MIKDFLHKHLTWSTLPPFPGDATVFAPVVAVKPEVIRIASSARVDSFTKLEGGEALLIEENVHIASFCHVGVGGGVTIVERGATIASGAKLISGTSVPAEGRSCSAVSPDCVKSRRYVYISQNATVFANAVVLPGVTVGLGAVIAAGAVVTKDVPPNEIWAGVPARRIGVVPREADA